MELTMMKLVSLTGFAAAMFIALIGIADKDHWTAAFGIIMMIAELIAFLKM